MPYRGNRKQYLIECWNGEIAEECYSESGILEVTALTFNTATGKGMYGVIVNDELAYQSTSSYQAAKVYEEFKRS